MNDGINDAVAGILGFLIWFFILRWIWRRIIWPIIHIIATGIRNAWRWLANEHRKNVEKYSG